MYLVVRSYVNALLLRDAFARELEALTDRVLAVLLEGLVHHGLLVFVWVVVRVWFLLDLVSGRWEVDCGVCEDGYVEP